MNFQSAKIRCSLIEPKLLWILGIHFTQEFIGVGFRMGLKLGAITLLEHSKLLLL